jgi:uncharacterized membrane protein YqgA involved in biofilm formation
MTLFLLGTLVNTAAILVGSLIGLVLPRIPDRMRDTVMSGMGLVVMLIGLSMGLSDMADVLLIIVSMVLGGVLGEWCNIDGALERLGRRVEDRFRGKGDNAVAQSFVAATLLFCVGSMAIVGAIQSGAQLHHETLYAKSVLDGFSSVILASTLGFGVIFAAIPVLAYEGLIATLAHYAGTVLNSPPVIQCLTATGGLLIFAIGLNMLGRHRIAVANLLPAMFIAAFLKWAMLTVGVHLGG